MTRHQDWLAARAAERDAAGLHRSLEVVDPAEGLLDLAGNDYLGLSRDPRVIEGAVRAATRYGAGAGASRLVTGTLPVHRDLEERLAEFTGFGAALVLSTGYHANLAAVTALSDADTLVVSDAHVHASLVDACRLSRARVQVVAHHDLAAVERALAERPESRAVVLVESVYSVLGDAASLHDLAALCARHDALLLADEAHALGVCGPSGAGLLAEAGLAGRPDVVATVTLSKALGAQGGAVLAAPEIREHLINTARPFIYDTGLAPASAGAAAAALSVIGAEPERVARVHGVAAALAEAADVDRPAGAVLSVAMPGPREAVDAMARARSEGVRIGCFRPPSTPDGISRLRLTAHSEVSPAELANAVAVLRSVTR